MDPNHFRLYIVRDALKTANWWSPAVENLLVGTAMVETGLEKLVQVGGGPALGIFQIEPRTFGDVIDYIKRDPEKVKVICQACHFDSLPSDVNVVIWNMRFSVLITRMFYYRIPDALPKPDDFNGLYNYYKSFYNSSAGAATIERDLPIFKQICSYKD